MIYHCHWVKSLPPYIIGNGFPQPPTDLHVSIGFIPFSPKLRLTLVAGTLSPGTSVCVCMHSTCVCVCMYVCACVCSTSTSPLTAYNTYIIYIIVIHIICLKLMMHLTLPCCCRYVQTMHMLPAMKSQCTGRTVCLLLSCFFLIRWDWPQSTGRNTTNTCSINDTLLSLGLHMHHLHPVQVVALALESNIANCLSGNCRETVCVYIIVLSNAACTVCTFSVKAMGKSRQLSYLTYAL